MFRRIEIISHFPDTVLDDGTKIDQPSHYKGGLMGYTNWDIVDAFMPENGPSLRGPWGKRNPSIPRNARFYFTELGWDKIGRKVVAACLRTKTDYRIIKIKETDAQVCWRDEFTNYEVAVQPRKKR